MSQQSLLEDATPIFYKPESGKPYITYRLSHQGKQFSLETKWVKLMATLILDQALTIEEARIILNDQLEKTCGLCKRKGHSIKCSKYMYESRQASS